MMAIPTENMDTKEDRMQVSQSCKVRLFWIKDGFLFVDLGEGYHCNVTHSPIYIHLYHLAVLRDVYFEMVVHLKESNFFRALECDRCLIETILIIQ